VRVRKAESRYRELLRIERSTRLGELAGSLAHELNQPLAAILSSARAALRYLKSGYMEPDLFREILNQIAIDDKRAASIISSMRNMLKKGSADTERIEINDLVAEGVTIFHGEAVNRSIRIETLSPREQEVFRHVISGRLNKQIACDLDIAEQTVKIHRGRIMKKLAVDSFAELVRLADKAGIVPAP
jgi:DNA-binding NarL/FixJ family response regulator